MNYYEIYDRYSDELLTRGNAAECRKALGCASLDSFYALANRARRGINKKYRVVIKKGGQVDYPVLGKDDPLYFNTVPQVILNGIYPSKKSIGAKRIEQSSPSVP